MAAPALLSLPLLLSGCSGGDSASASAPSSAPPSVSSPVPSVSGEPPKRPKGEVLPEMAPFFQCLKEKGLPMKDTPSGIPVVDDSKADPEKTREAERACESLVPATPVSAEQHAKAKEFTACMRAHGIAEFPDPDPKTARHDYEGMGLKGTKEGDEALRACAWVR
ncbi:hypothetical protein ACGFYU_30575 [Streptomyces sp. NPDC048337]|uniref:hypothetical protein n=1 Tax=Streptomyces sp. NPDC048337 TaxID=3365535 RepID=UPI0037157108